MSNHIRHIIVPCDMATNNHVRYPQMAMLPVNLSASSVKSNLIEKTLATAGGQCLVLLVLLDRR